jgi:hypothetical protein
MLTLLLILVHQTASASAGNDALHLQGLEEDKDGNVVKESHLRKEPRKVKVDAKEDKSSSTSTLQSHDQFIEGDKDFFFDFYASEQEAPMVKRNLSIVNATEETANVDSTPVIIVDCNNTDTELADECDLDVDVDLGRCDWFVDDETKALTCFIIDNKEKDIIDDEEKDIVDTLDYKDNPLFYPDISYDYEDANDEDAAYLGVTYGYEDAKDDDEEKSSKSGKQAGPVRGLVEAVEITDDEREETLRLIDETSELVNGAEMLYAPTRESVILQLLFIRNEVAKSEEKETKDNLKEVKGVLEQVVKSMGDLTSGDHNRQFKGALEITSKAALLLNKVSPPIGTVFSQLFKLAATLTPFPTSPTETLEGTLRRVLEEHFAEFRDHLLARELSRVQGQLEAFHRHVQLYGTYEDLNLRVDRDRIYTLLNNNQRDTSYSFLQEMGDNFINPSNSSVAPLWESNPEQMANRILSFYQVARDRINLCKRIGIIFARLGNMVFPDMTQEERAIAENDRARSIFWIDGEVDATRNLAGRYLGVLTRPPSDESSGIAAHVLKALHQIQSQADREMFEEFMAVELGLRIPGTVLQIRNLEHDQYIEVSEGECPMQHEARYLGFARPVRTVGFELQGMCPYVETTPGDAFAGDEGTDWNKVFRVYGNRQSFTLWNIGMKAYVRGRELFMPTYTRSGRADAYFEWNRFPTSRLPLKYQVDSPVTSSSQWEFEFNPGERETGAVAPASCNVFTLGRRLNLSGIGPGDTIFNRCLWSHGQVEYTIYSTNWGTATQNGNGRNRNQVLLWTQLNSRCCATSGQGDRVRQGVWHFQKLDGSVFYLPSSGEM